MLQTTHVLGFHCVFEGQPVAHESTQQKHVTVGNEKVKVNSFKLQSRHQWFLQWGMVLVQSDHWPAQTVVFICA